MRTQQHKADPTAEAGGGVLGEAGEATGANLSCTSTRLAPKSATVQTTCTPNGGRHWVLFVQAHMKDGRVLTAPIQRLPLS